MLLHALLLSLHVTAAAAQSNQASMLRSIALVICAPARLDRARGLATLDGDEQTTPRAAGYDCPLCSGFAPHAVALPDSTLLDVLRPRAKAVASPAIVALPPRPEIRAEKSRGPPLPTFV